MQLVVRDTAQKASSYVAEYIVKRVADFEPSASRPFVLGLPTGSSPEVIYKNLVEFHNNGKISFQHVVTFNMDEYVGIPRDHAQSYHTFMYNHLFSHVDIQPKNVHILNGNAADLERECDDYENAILAHGGIELFLGGVGPDGHIAFNEPGSSLSSKTRVKGLAHSTIVANARFFGGDLDSVPTRALTVGVGTIMQAREVVIIATGSAKGMAVKKGVEGSINHSWTISALQAHPRWIMAVDDAACQELKVKTLKYFQPTDASKSRQSQQGEQDPVEYFKDQRRAQGVGYIAKL